MNPLPVILAGLKIFFYFQIGPVKIGRLFIKNIIYLKRGQPKIEGLAENH